jgi:hypothetical protein
MPTTIKMASLEILSSKIQKAFEVYGQKLGITLPDAELKLTSTWVQKIPIRNPHFYLSTEPVPEDATWKAKEKLIKEGLLRHCVPSTKGFYDYLAHKHFPTLRLGTQMCRRIVQFLGSLCLFMVDGLAEQML